MPNTPLTPDEVRALLARAETMLGDSATVAFAAWGNSVAEPWLTMLEIMQATPRLAAEWLAMRKAARTVVGRLSVHFTTDDVDGEIARVAGEIPVEAYRALVMFAFSEEATDGE